MRPFEFAGVAQWQSSAFVKRGLEVRFAPMIEELAGKYQGKMKMVKLNIDDYPQLAGQFRVMNIPTLLFFEGGKEVDRIVGVVPKEELARRIDTVISS